MAKYANQKTLKINKAGSGINMLNHRKANKDLGKNAFKVYADLCCNKNGFILDLSCSAMCNRTGLKRDAYYQAINELIEKRYLVLVEKNYYDFFEIAQEDDIRLEDIL